MKASADGATSRSLRAWTASHALVGLTLIVTVYSVAVGVIVLLVTMVIAAVVGSSMRTPLQVAAAATTILAGGLGGAWLMVERLGVIGFERSPAQLAPAQVGTEGAGHEFKPAVKR